MVHPFSTKFKLFIDRFSALFAEQRKLVEKMIHEKKNRGHRMSKIEKAINSNGRLPYHWSFYYLAHTLDTWCAMWICVCGKDVQRQLERTS